MRTSRKMNWRLIGRKIDQQFADRDSKLWGCLAWAVVIGGTVAFLTATTWIHWIPGVD